MRERFEPDHDTFPSRALGTACRPTRALIVCAALGVMAVTERAEPATFDVAARILCPASWFVGPNTLDPTYGTSVMLPCAGVRVVAMDADPDFDDYCGSAYTDSRGRVLFRADCDDPGRSLPDVYLRVEGRSVSGFSVGVVETNVLERIADSLDAAWDRFVEDGVPIPVPVLDELRSHQTLAWVAATRTPVRNGGSIDEGTLAIGAAGTGALSVMAARQFWAAQFAMFRLDAGTRYRPMPFNYTVNAPLPAFTPAFTAYDTIVVDVSRTPAAASPVSLFATPHEIGHVLYNTYHSDNLHWVGDCLDIFCFRPHTRCVGEQLNFAWYEGFGHFVRDYVHQQFAWPTWSWSTASPPPGCALEGGAAPVSMSVEGNVEGLLNNVFFGPVRPMLLTAANPTSGGLAFGCPDGSPPQPTATGALECVVERPVTCATGTLRVDPSGVRDDCLDFVDDPRCARHPRRHQPNFSCPYDPVAQVNTPNCASRVARPGRDACATRVPAIHTLPFGNPAPRPDGTPNMTLGMNTAGGQAWFSLPALDDVMGWVDEAGLQDHRAREYWERRIKPWCRRGDGSQRDRYCHPVLSPTFFGELTTLDPALN